jgi:protein O-GlcNAc transferase
MRIDRDARTRLLQSAFERHQSGQLAEAEALYRQVLADDPDDPDANYLLGMLADAVGQKKSAIELIQRSIRSRPNDAEAHRNLGLIFAECALHDQAIASYGRSIALDPSVAETHNALGVAFKAIGKKAAAMAAFEHALTADPSYAVAHNNLGIALAQLGRASEAENRYRSAIAIDPNVAEPHNNLGSLLADLGRADEAIACYRRALAIRPDYLSALNGLAASLLNKPDIAGAIEMSQKALARDPDSEAATATLFHGLQFACDWREIDEVREKLDRQTRAALQRGARPEETPFKNIGRADDPALNLAVASAWSAYHVRELQPEPYPERPVSQRSAEARITVGYLSSDLYNHAIGHLTRGLFALHDRDRFRIHVYSAGKDDGSVYRREAECDSDLFADIRGMSSPALARRIHEDAVDILVDVNGYTRHSRMQAAAWRPCPVQVTWLGFPGTTGAAYFDYIVTDRVVTPDDHRAHYSESFAYLPHCYQMNEAIAGGAAGSGQVQADRSKFDLPGERFIYCSFVNSFKIEPALFDAWMRILQATGDSILLLFAANEVAPANLRREAQARGIDPGRLLFGGNLAREEHLARLGCADLALDSWTYGGHTTTSDALRTGVPVVVRTGNHFASRVSTSILRAAGLDRLVTGSGRDYEALAIRLAHDRAMLAAVAAELAVHRMTCPLFDAAKFVRSLEDCYRQMWTRYCRGERPTTIAAR